MDSYQQYGTNFVKESGLLVGTLQQETQGQISDVCMKQSITGSTIFRSFGLFGYISGDTLLQQVSLTIIVQVTSLNKQIDYIQNFNKIIVDRGMYVLIGTQKVVEFDLDKTPESQDCPCKIRTASLLPCSHICYHLKQRDCLNEETLSLFVDKDMYSIINCVKSLNKYLVKDQVSMTVQSKIEQQVIDIDDSDCQNIVPKQYTSLDLTPQELQLIQYIGNKLNNINQIQINL
ncbi:Hypothetical_protein [Hexamita inflata]|uniref:Hypothetical_protein n=1 Tax=Hexamita inflata TaxID=28002 RepID=A0AA86N9C5_9EUKA|nr:Hypothetical protein HINF_LOCUS3084 [Hexamita inflata]